MRVGQIIGFLTAMLLGVCVAFGQIVSRIDSIGLTVADLNRSIDFYSRVLTFEKVSEVEFAGDACDHLNGVFGSRVRIARMKLGDEFAELTEYIAPKGRPFPIDSRSNDRWFQHMAIVVSDMDKAYELLRARRVQHASTSPQRLPDWNAAAAGIKAFYFRDPDGHYLEILSFPQGKGNPKWRKATDRLFLGIDHTAIVAQDTEASLKFYQDKLGLKVVGESENYGTEQEHLNNVFGARLRITSLRAASGPGVELLEYLAPADGRPMPVDEKANDLIHWEVRMVTPRFDGGEKDFRNGWPALVSPGVVSLPTAKLGTPEAMTGRDPDGHVIQIVSEERSRN